MAGPPDLPTTSFRVAAVVLAAGSSSRMGPRRDKLLEDVRGRRIVDHVVASALASGADPVVVVVPVADGELASSLPRGVTVVENERRRDGLSTSLIAGLRGLPEEVDGVVVMLGDMPLVGPDDVDALIAEFRPDRACVPVVDGRRGNPVLWPRGFFPRIFDLSGDRGARSILEAEADRVVEVPRGNRGLLLDVDTPDDLAAIRHTSRP